MSTTVEPNLEELPVDRTDAPNPDLIPNPNYTSTPATSEHWDIGFFSQFGRDLGYSLGSFFVAIPAFTAAVSLFTLGVSTAVIYIGLFALIACLFCASFFAAGERSMAEWNRGKLPAHVYKARVASGQKGIFTPLTDPLRWSEMLHAILIFPLRVTVFCVALTWLVTGPGELTAFFWKRYLPNDSQDVWDLIGLEKNSHFWLDFGVGVFFILTLPFVLKGSALLLRVLASGMLTNESSVLKEQVRRAEASRDSAVSAEAGNLRRLERDIHDGPQQRLVRVSMDLKSAQRRLTRGEPGAEELVAEALKQTQDTLGELRAISRGIAPPILVDRGLPAAVEAAAARTPLPVIVRVEGLDETRRLAASVENTAYFIVAESLTNVAKHANASQVDVELLLEGETLKLSIADDGQGGAHLGKGHGLVGLQERTVAGGGEFALDSSEKGTTIKVSLPLRAF